MLSAKMSYKFLQSLVSLRVSQNKQSFPFPFVASYRKLEACLRIANIPIPRVMPRIWQSIRFTRVIWRTQIMPFT